MTIHVTGIDTLDNYLRDMKNVPAGLLMMTVYGGCDSTKVRCRIDGGEWLLCHKDSPQARKGAFIGITGENLTLAME